MLTDKRPQSRLVIISVPIYRIARVTLSEIVLKHLIKSADVVIVAPFADQKGFQGNFSFSGAQFLNWQIKPINKLLNLFLGFSEILRRNGYWRRFKNNGLGYYLKNQHTIFGDDGIDIEDKFFKKHIVNILSFIGVWPKAWRVIDNLIGEFIFTFPELEEVTNGYNEVILIQSASWGNQDRVLSYNARKFNWRTVLIPYTTDQLAINGYLMSNFDAVCVQGAFEAEKSKVYHGLSEDKIFKLGSVWFRHLDFLIGEMNQRGLLDNTEKQDKTKNKRTILYAGLATPFFPRSSELKAIDIIIDLIESAELENCHLVYRPVEFTLEGQNLMKSRYRDKKCLTLQFPAHSSIGLGDYKEINHAQSLYDHVAQINDCALVVMSWNTTLGMDIAYVSDCAVIENRYDPTNTLLKRLYNEQKQLGDYNIPHVSSEKELRDTIKSFVDDRELSRIKGRESIQLWDYENMDFYRTLDLAVFNSNSPSVSV